MESSSAAALDEENPVVSSQLSDRTGHTVGGFRLLEALKHPDPGFGITATSILTNFAICNMFVYGATGNWRLGLLSGALTVPFSTILCILDTAADYELWKQIGNLKLQGADGKKYVLKAKYDWSEYEPYMRASKGKSRGVQR